MSCSFLLYKNWWQKTLNLTIKCTSVPKKLWSFLPLNQKASLVVPEEIETEREMKRTIFKWVLVLAVMKPVKFYKKTTIKWTFSPCKEASNFCQTNYPEMKKKGKDNRKKRTMWDFWLKKLVRTYQSIMVIFFVIWTWIFCHGCGLCAAVSHCSVPCF